MNCHSLPWVARVTRICVEKWVPNRCLFNHSASRVYVKASLGYHRDSYGSYALDCSSCVLRRGLFWVDRSPSSDCSSDSETFNLLYHCMLHLDNLLACQASPETAVGSCESQLVSPRSSSFAQNVRATNRQTNRNKRSSPRWRQLLAAWMCLLVTVRLSRLEPGVGMRLGGTEPVEALLWKGFG